MSPEVIALAVLVVVFLIATVRGVNMGALALVAAFVVGLAVFGVDSKEVLKGFPAELFVILVGVTYLFALAKNNGTVDWIVHGAVRAVPRPRGADPLGHVRGVRRGDRDRRGQPGGRRDRRAGGRGLRPALPDPPRAHGDDGRAGRHRRKLLPIGIFGSITNGVVDANDLPGSPLFLFGSTFVACAVIAVVAFAAFGGRELIARGADADALSTLGATAESAAHAATSAARPTNEPHSAAEVQRLGEDPSDDGHDDVTRLDAQRIGTLAGLVALIVGALGFDLDVGFTALAIAVVLTLAFPESAKDAVEKISWSTVLLIAGIVTYVALLQKEGVVDWLGDGVAKVGSPWSRRC